MKVSTEWVAFLDSDDEFLPNHLEVLHTAAQEHEADYVFSWFETVPPGRDPFPQHFGKLWDNNLPRHTTITTLVRTSIAQQVGFLKYGKPGEMICSNEDWFFTLGCLEAGAKFYHVPERTWRWYHHGKNSSGMPTKGDAR
jgi:glycosyltransferase involved in cell wall biosynthesis